MSVATAPIETAQIVGDRVDGGAGGLAQFGGLGRALDRMIHAADDVGAPGHLRVLDAEAGDALAAFQVDQEPGDIGGAEIDGQAQACGARRMKIRSVRPRGYARAATSRPAAGRPAGDGPR